MTGVWISSCCSIYTNEFFNGSLSLLSIWQHDAKIYLFKIQLYYLFIFLIKWFKVYFQEKKEINFHIIFRYSQGEWQMNRLLFSHNILIVKGYSYLWIFENVNDRWHRWPCQSSIWKLPNLQTHISTRLC